MWPKSTHAHDAPRPPLCGKKFYCSELCTLLSSGRNDGLLTQAMFSLHDLLSKIFLLSRKLGNSFLRSSGPNWDLAMSVDRKLQFQFKSQPELSRTWTLVNLLLPKQPNSRVNFAILLKDLSRRLSRSATSVRSTQKRHWLRRASQMFTHT